MLHDSVRIRAFRRAIENAVGPGDVVAEIGAGLGTYSFFTCLAGAERVYAVEDEVFGALEAIASRQGFGDRLRLVKGNSLDIALPEKVDLIIYEDFGSAFLGSGLFSVLSDARERFLKPGGAWLPPAAVVCGALCEAPGTWKGLAAWSGGADHLDGLDFGPLSGWMLNSKIRDNYPPEGLISSPRDLSRFRWGREEEGFALSRRMEENPLRSGTVHGLCVWFRLEFACGEVLDNAPGADDTVYRQVFFPLSAPIPVKAGEPVEWSVNAVSGGGGGELWWSWRVESRGAAAEGTTFASFPYSAKSLRKRSDIHVPKPGKRQKLLKFVLDSADGKATQGEIAARVFEAFPDKFTSEKEALGFVAGVLAD
jgi:protein arginine N-methyltransferase 1